MQNLHYKEIARRAKMSEEDALWVLELLEDLPEYQDFLIDECFVCGGENPQ